MKSSWWFYVLKNVPTVCKLQSKDIENHRVRTQWQQYDVYLCCIYQPNVSSIQRHLSNDPFSCIEEKQEECSVSWRLSYTPDIVYLLKHTLRKGPVRHYVTKFFLRRCGIQGILMYTEVFLSVHCIEQTVENSPLSAGKTPRVGTKLKWNSLTELIEVGVNGEPPNERNLKYNLFEINFHSNWKCVQNHKTILISKTWNRGCRRVLIFGDGFCIINYGFCSYLINRWI